MNTHVSYQVRDGMARVTLDAPGDQVNILNRKFLQQLDETAERLEKETGITSAVVLSAKEKGFIAGADVRALASISTAAEGTRLAREGQRILERWARLPFPVVAALHGHCLGGGTEFALACTSRVADDSATIGLPETRLGILPGFGGTQRLPRLIPLEHALGIILAGRTLKAPEALNVGLIDKLAPREELEEQAVAMARSIVADPSRLPAERRARKRSVRTMLLEGNPLGRALLFRGALKRLLRKTGGHYPAPPRALETVRRTFHMPIEQGMEIEAVALGDLSVTAECKNLLHVFFLGQKAKKGAPVEAPARPVNRAAVLGGGVMGSGIAWLLADRGIPVLLREVDQKRLDGALERINGIFSKRRNGDAPGKMERVEGITRLEADKFNGCDLVIEAVVERMEVKQQVLQEIEPLLGPDTIFATNTSALSVSDLQHASGRPRNVAGLHFFNPVHRMPLVEIIRGEQTSDDALATLFTTALRLGKTPIIVADRPGFLVNRLLVAYLNEACLMASEGVEWRSIESTMEQFGLPMGPFRLIDEVGIDIAAEVGATLARAFPYLEESALLTTAYLNGLSGRKEGKGFYLYTDGHPPRPNPAAADLLGLSGTREATGKDLRRLLLMMVNEAARCLDEGVVSAASDIDTGMIFGTGFPPFLGGLCRWSDNEGVEKVTAELKTLANEKGERFLPAQRLSSGIPFYTEESETARGVQGE